MGKHTGGIIKFWFPLLVAQATIISIQTITRPHCTHTQPHNVHTSTHAHMHTCTHAHVHTMQNERLFESATAESIHDLIKHGANVDARRANGSTPLIVHSSAGNKEVVQALIEEKANVDIQDNNGWSALMVASRSGHTEIVRSLIYAGAIPDLKNKEVSYSNSVVTGNLVARKLCCGNTIS